MKKPPRLVRPHPTDPTAALVELTRGYWAIIDVVDSTEVGRFNWFAWGPGHSRSVYAGRNVTHNPHTSQGLHRFVAALAGVDLSHEIDHRNGNGLDCRRQNLRSATASQNRWNILWTGRAGVTGVKGVHFEAWTGRYRVEIRMKNKSFRLGRFDTLAEAEAVAIAARQKMHGEFANNGQRVPLVS